MTPETWLKIHTNVYNFVTASPKPYKLFFFYLNYKIRHASTTWKELIRKSLCLPIFRNITEIVKKLRVYMVLGDDVTKLQRFVWLFNHVSRVITWSLFNLRAPNWSNDQPQHDLSYDGVSSSICLNLKLAPVPYATPKWPIGTLVSCPINEFRGKSTSLMQ